MKLFNTALVGISIGLIFGGGFMLALYDLNGEGWLAVGGSLLIMISLFGLFILYRVPSAGGQSRFSLIRTTRGIASLIGSLVGVIMIGIGLPFIRNFHNFDFIFGWFFFLVGIMVVVVSRVIKPKD